MKSSTMSYGYAAAVIALSAMVVLHGLNLVPGVRAITPAKPDADLSSEARALDAFVTDLTRLDARTAELGKKASFTRAEFDSLEIVATGLKRRLSEVQSALGAVIRKLKAADQWNNLNATLLTRTRDSRFQAFVRSEDFKKVLEDSASTLVTDAGQIDSRLAPLRAKVARAQSPGFESDSAAPQVVRAGFGPTVFTSGFRCRLSGVRLGVALLVFGAASGSQGALDSFNCHCRDDQAACAQAAR